MIWILLFVGYGQRSAMAVEFTTQAACEYAHTIAVDYHSKGNSFRDWNEWHKVAFHRSLPYFERLLGPVKNRRNPRSLIELDLVNGTASIIDN